MDRDNLLAHGWSHVVSSNHDIAELEAFRVEVGAPPPALQLANARWPHLDLKDEPRQRALVHPDVIVLETTRDLIRFVRRQHGKSS